MSSPNPYNPQGQIPQGPYNPQNQYNQQPGRFAGSVDEGIDAIPMKKSSPLMVLIIAGGAVLVVGAAAFSFMGGKKKTIPAQQAAAVEVTQADEAAKAKAVREHMEITRRSLENLERTKAASAPEKPAAEAEAEAEEPSAAPAAAQASPARPGAARPAAARPAPVAQAPQPKPVNKAVAKKKMDSLDDLGKDITGELGK